MSAEGQKGDLAMAEWLEAIGVTWLASRAGGASAAVYWYWTKSIAGSGPKTSRTGGVRRLYLTDQSPQTGRRARKAYL